MAEIDLLQKPQIKRILDKNWRSKQNRIIARRFDKDFFDGDRINGYGGYKYDGRWKAVVKRMQEVYGINEKSSVLDLGCGKGFLLHDLKEMVPGISVAGLDISKYAIENGMDSVKPFMVLGSADELPYADNTFDMVLSLDTIHNLPLEKCEKALQEIMRVCKPNGHKFILVDAYNNDEEKANMEAWNLTALTHMYVNEWLEFFKNAGYDGDYFWTIMR